MLPPGQGTRHRASASVRVGHPRDDAVHGRGRGPDGQALRAPRLESADDVRDRLEAQIDEDGCRQARRVAVRAEQHDPAVTACEVGIAPAGARVGAPLEHRPRDVERARDDALATAVVGGANVDDERLSGGGRAAYEAQASEDVLGRRWRTILERVA